MKKILLSLFIFSFFLLFSLSFVKAQEYYISNCSIIDQENATYYLTQDIIDSNTSTCIDIQANNTVLDCQGHTIDGIDRAESFGIYISRGTVLTETNITIKNCVLSDWDFGIYLYSSSSNILSNITSYSNSHSGIYLSDSNSNILSNITTDHNYYGIYIYHSFSNILSNITSSYNYHGIYIWISDYTTIKDSNIFSNTYFDINYETDKIYNYCHSSFENIVGTDNKPIVFFNTPIIIKNWNNNASEIILCSADNSIIDNITISHTTIKNNGLLLVATNFTNISNSVFSNSWHGIYLYSSSSNILSNITSYSNSHSGIYLDYSNFNVLSNIITSNSYYGIYLRYSQGNLIYNSIFNNTYDNEIEPYYINYWNTTLQTGNNIWNTSLGYIGGNYWTNPDGNGYSDTCHDTNADGFCDDPYILATDNIDYLPIAKTVGQGAIPTPTCVEPYENMVINNDTILCSGSYYLNDSDRNGAIIINGNNFTIICNNTEIYGDYNTNWEQGIGFRIDAKNVTIIGCKLRDYANPIELFNTEDVILKEINITHYGVRGIWGLNNTRLIIRDSYFSDHWDNWGASIDLSGGEEDGNYPCEKINSFDLIYNNTFKDMTLSTRFGECVYNLTIDNNYFENIYVSIIGDLGQYKLKETSSINITNNIIKSNWFGIIISGPDNINIFGNYILGEIGVYAENSNNITIEDSKLIQKIPQIEEIGYLIYFVNISGSNVKGSLMKNGNISISNGANIEISNSTLEFINGNYYSYLNLTDSKIYNNTFYVVNENYSSTVSSYFYLNSTNFEFFDNVIYTNKSTNNAIFSTLIRYSAYNSSFYNNYGYGEYPNAVIIGSISYSSSNAEKIYVYNNYIESTGSYCIQSTKGSEHYIYNNRIDDGCIMVLGPVSNTYIHDNNISYFGIVGVNNEINNMIAYNNTLRADSSDYPNKKIWYGDIDIGTKLYGNNIYHPETTTLDPYLSITLNYTEIDYGLVMPYNYYNYIGGITIDTNRIDYKIEVNSTNLVNGTNVIDKSNFSFGFSKTTDFNFLIKPYNTITILKQLLQDSYNILTRLYIPLVYPLRYEGVINITASLGLSENQIL